MRQIMSVVVLVWCGVMLCGCDAVRFAPGEEQKANAYLHWRATELAAAGAKADNTTPQLQGLTALSAQQSRAFVADYGLPAELPAADTAEAILAAGGVVAEAAYEQSLERPDVWQAAEGALELGIGLAGLLGGVYGARVVQFLRQAQEKSKALKEIIAGNELFKRECPEQAEAFKTAQQGQSTATRILVAGEKAAG
ncbi:MAG: hypothetical protein ABFD91_07565 [Anaerohalosphaeraceae bacterium]